jgi:hypothetical protein
VFNTYTFLLIFKILRSICTYLNNKDQGLDCYVINNAPRPLLSYGPKNSRTLRRSYLYIDAVQKYAPEPKELNLTEAYKKAKPSFTGKLERHFILLKDNPGEEEAMDLDSVATGANLEPLFQ